MKERKANMLGLARRDKGLMQALIPPKGYVVASSDASAGEPTIISHFTKDPFYKYAAFDGIGKKPKYSQGVLMIDDIYLMGGSVSPMAKDKIHEWFTSNDVHNQWLVNHDACIAPIKAERTFLKMLILALGYGMQAKKMEKTSRENGYSLTIQEARAFYQAYWDLFEYIRGFSNKLQRYVEKKGYLYNPFGFRVTPEPHKAFNAFVQSSVNGLMVMFLKALLEESSTYADYVITIHDELVFFVKEDRQEDFEKAKEIATTYLNSVLQWSVPVRFGLVFGPTFYEAK